jgi:hypothetical protein
LNFKTSSISCMEDENEYMESIQSTGMVEHTSQSNLPCPNSWTQRASMLTAGTITILLKAFSDSILTEYIWGSGGIAPPFLTTALDGNEWLASCPGRFIPGQRFPVPIVQETGWTLEPLWRRGKSCPCRESNPGSPRDVPCALSSSGEGWGRATFSGYSLIYPNIISLCLPL